MTAAEKRLEASLQTEKTAGFLRVIHNEGPQRIERAAHCCCLAHSASATAKCNNFYFNCFVNEWQGTLECVLLGLLKPCCAFKTCGLGTPPSKASRNTAHNSELKMFERGGSLLHDQASCERKGVARDVLGYCWASPVLRIGFWIFGVAGSPLKGPR